MKRRLSLVMAGVLTFTCLHYNMNEYSAIAETDPYYKIDDSLSQVLGSHDTYSVMIWIDDIDHEAVKERTETSLGFRLEEVERAEAHIIDAAFSRHDMSFDKGDDEDLSFYDEIYRTEIAEIKNEIHAYVSTSRNISMEKYIENNQSFIDELEFDLDVIYSSRYVPAIFAEVSEDEVYDLCENDRVTSLILMTDGEIVYDDCSDYGTADYTASDLVQNRASNYISYINATAPKMAGLTGSGAVVGLLDEGYVYSSSHPDLNNTTIYQTGSAPGVSPATHSIKMARIICGTNGVAPAATLYSASHNNQLSSYYYQGMEDLLSAGVDIINCSFGEHKTGMSGFYLAKEKWTEHIIQYHNVAVAVAAGNDGSFIDDPGQAYNSITVGNADYQTDTMVSASNYIYGTGCRKPDIAAPGEGVLGSGGTSAATAVVSGVLALMIGLKPSIATHPTSAKAILLAGCTKYVGGGTLHSGHESKQGAGLVDVVSLLAILSHNRYMETYVSTNTTYSHNVSVNSGSVLHSAVFAGVKMSSGGSGNHITQQPSYYPMPTVDFSLDNGYGTTLTSDTGGATTSVRIVRYTINTTTLTLELDVSYMSSIGMIYALAWR